MSPSRHWKDHPPIRRDLRPGSDPALRKGLLIGLAIAIGFYLILALAWWWAFA